MKKLYIVLLLSVSILTLGAITIKTVFPNKDLQKAVLEKQIYDTFERLDKEYVEKLYTLYEDPSKETIDHTENKALQDTATQYKISTDEVKGIIVRLTEQKYK